MHRPLSKDRAARLSALMDDTNQPEPPAIITSSLPSSRDRRLAAMLDRTQSENGEHYVVSVESVRRDREKRFMEETTSRLLSLHGGSSSVTHSQADCEPPVDLVTLKKMRGDKADHRAELSKLQFQLLDEQTRARSLEEELVEAQARLRETRRRLIEAERVATAELPPDLSGKALLDHFEREARQSPEAGDEEWLVKFAAAYRSGRFTTVQLQFIGDVATAASSSSGFVPSPLTAELFQKVAAAGSPVSAALVFSYNVGGPRRSALRQLLAGPSNSGPICPSTLPTEEEGGSIMRDYVQSLSEGKFTSFRDMKPSNRPLLQIVTDGTGVNGQLGHDIVNGIPVPNGMYDDDATRPIVALTDDASVNQSFYDAHGQPRKRYTLADAWFLNSLNRNEPPTTVALIGGRPADVSHVTFCHEVQHIFRMVDMNGGRYGGVSGDGAALMENFYQEHCTLNQDRTTLPASFIGISFSDGSFLFGELILNYYCDLYHLLFPDTDPRHAIKKFIRPAHRLNRLIVFGAFVIAIAYYVLLHVIFPVESGVRRDTYDSTDSQNVRAAQAAATTKAQACMADLHSRHGFETKAMLIWMQHLYALDRSYLDMSLPWEERLIFAFSAYYFVTGHKYYCTHNPSLSWHENGVVSEVELRDIRWLASRLVVVVVYYLLEHLTTELHFDESGSQCAEDGFSDARTRVNQSELSFGELKRNLPWRIRELRRRSSKNIKGAPKNNKNKGETYGSKASAFNPMREGLTVESAISTAEAAATKAKTIVLAQFADMGIKLPDGALPDIRVLLRGHKDHDDLGEAFVHAPTEEALQHTAGAVDETRAMSVDQISEIIDLQENGFEEGSEFDSPSMAQAVAEMALPRPTCTEVADSLLKEAEVRALAAQEQSAEGEEAQESEERAQGGQGVARGGSLVDRGSNERAAYSTAPETRAAGAGDAAPLPNRAVFLGLSAPAPATALAAEVDAQSEPRVLRNADGITDLLAIATSHSAPRTALTRNSGARTNRPRNLVSSGQYLNFNGSRVHVLALASTAGGGFKTKPTTRQARFFSGYASGLMAYEQSAAQAQVALAETRIKTGDVVSVYIEGPTTGKGKHRAKSPGTWRLAVVIGTQKVSPKRSCGGFPSRDAPLPLRGTQSESSSAPVPAKYTVAVELLERNGTMWTATAASSSSASGIYVYTSPVYCVLPTECVLAHTMTRVDSRKPKTGEIDEALVEQMDGSLENLRIIEQKKFADGQAEKQRVALEKKASRAASTAMMTTSDLREETALVLGANLFGSPDVNVVRAVADAIREATEVVVHCSNLANSVKEDLKLEGMSRIVCASSPIGGGFAVQGIKRTWIGPDVTGLILVEVGGVKVSRLHGRSDEAQLHALYSKAASKPGTMRFLKLTEPPDLFTEPVPGGWTPALAAPPQDSERAHLSLLPLPPQPPHVPQPRLHPPHPPQLPPPQLPPPQLPPPQLPPRQHLGRVNSPKRARCGAVESSSSDSSSSDDEAFEFKGEYVTIVEDGEKSRGIVTNTKNKGMRQTWYCLFSESKLHRRSTWYNRSQLARFMETARANPPCTHADGEIESDSDSSQG